jgi:hypothetical protein
MKLSFIFLLFSIITPFSYSQDTFNKNSLKKQCVFENIVGTQFDVLKYNNNPNKFKYKYNYVGPLNDSDSLNLYIDNKVCSYFTKNYKKTGFVHNDNHYKIKDINVNTLDIYNNINLCNELENDVILFENSCLVKDLDDHITTTLGQTTTTLGQTTTTLGQTTTTLGQTTTTLGQTTTTLGQTTTTLGQTTTTLGQTTTTLGQTTTTSGQTTTSISTDLQNNTILNNNEQPQTQESVQKTSKELSSGEIAGIIVGLVVGLVLFGIVIVRNQKPKSNNYDVNNNSNISNEKQINEYLEPTDSLYLEPVSSNPEYDTSHNEEPEKGVYYTNEPISSVEESISNHDYEYADSNQSPVYDNNVPSSSNVYESDE